MTQGNPYGEGSGKFEVEIIDNEGSETYEIWGESKEDISKEIAPLLGDEQAVEVKRSAEEEVAAEEEVDEEVAAEEETAEQDLGGITTAIWTPEIAAAAKKASEAKGQKNKKKARQELAKAIREDKNAKGKYNVQSAIKYYESMRVEGKAKDKKQIVSGEQIREAEGTGAADGKTKVTTPVVTKEQATANIEAKKKQTSSSGLSVVGIGGKSREFSNVAGEQVQEGTDGIPNYPTKMNKKRHGSQTIISIGLRTAKTDPKDKSYQILRGKSGEHYLIWHDNGVLRKDGVGRTEALTVAFKIGKDISGLDKTKLLQEFRKKINSIASKDLTKSEYSGLTRYSITEISEKGEQIGNQLKEWYDGHVTKEIEGTITPEVTTETEATAEEETTPAKKEEVKEEVTTETEETVEESNFKEKIRLAESISPVLKKGLSAEQDKKLSSAVASWEKQSARLAEADEKEAPLEERRKLRTIERIAFTKLRNLSKSMNIEPDAAVQWYRGKTGLGEPTVKEEVTEEEAAETEVTEAEDAEVTEEGEVEVEPFLNDASKKKLGEALDKDAESKKGDKRNQDSARQNLTRAIKGIFGGSYLGEKAEMSKEELTSLRKELGVEAGAVSVGSTMTSAKRNGKTNEQIFDAINKVKEESRKAKIEDLKRQLAESEKIVREREELNQKKIKEKEKLDNTVKEEKENIKAKTEEARKLSEAAKNLNDELVQDLNIELEKQEAITLKDGDREAQVTTKKGALLIADVGLTQQAKDAINLVADEKRGEMQEKADRLVETVKELRNAQEELDKAYSDAKRKINEQKAEDSDLDNFLDNQKQAPIKDLDKEQTTFIASNEFMRKLREKKREAKKEERKKEEVAEKEAVEKERKEKVKEIDAKIKAEKNKLKAKQERFKKLKSAKAKKNNKEQQKKIQETIKSLEKEKKALQPPKVDVRKPSKVTWKPIGKQEGAKKGKVDPTQKEIKVAEIKKIDDAIAKEKKKRPRSKAKIAEKKANLERLQKQRKAISQRKTTVKDFSELENKGATVNRKKTTNISTTTDPNTGDVYYVGRDVSDETAKRIFAYKLTPTGEEIEIPVKTGENVGDVKRRIKQGIEKQEDLEVAPASEAWKDSSSSKRHKETWDDGKGGQYVIFGNAQDGYIATYKGENQNIQIVGKEKPKTTSQASKNKSINNLKEAVKKELKKREQEAEKTTIEGKKDSAKEVLDKVKEQNAKRKKEKKDRENNQKRINELQKKKRLTQKERNELEKLRKEVSGKRIQRSVRRDAKAGQFVESVVKRLLKRFPNIDVTIVSSQEEWNDIMYNEGFEIEDAQLIPSFYNKETGEVYINPNIADSKDVLEEFSHMWLRIAQSTNPSLYNRAAKLMEGTPYLEQVQAEELYSDLTYKEQLEEALAKAMRDKGALMLENENKFKQTLKRIWDGIKKALGINPRLNINTMTLDKFATVAAKDMLKTIPISKDMDSEVLAEMEKRGALRSGITMDASVFSDRTWMDKSTSFYKKNLTETRGVGRKRSELIKKAKSLGTMYTKKALLTTRAFHKTLDAYAESTVGKGRSRKQQRQDLKVEQQELINDFLTAARDPKNPNSISEEQQILLDQIAPVLQPYAKQMRDDLDVLENQLKETLEGTGALNGKLETVLTANKGMWLHRSYMRNDQKKKFEKYAQDWKNKMVVPQSHIRKIQEEQGLTKEEAEASARQRIIEDVYNVLTESLAKQGVKSATFNANKNSVTLKNEKGSEVEVSMRTLDNWQSTMSKENKNKIANLKKKIAEQKKKEEYKPIPTDFSIPSEATTKFKTQPYQVDDYIRNEIFSTTKEPVTAESAAENLKLKEWEKAVLKGRKDIPESIRILMGQYLTADINYVKSMAKAGMLSAKAKMESQILEEGEGTLVYREQPRGREGVDWVRIKNEESAVLGGMYTNPELYNAMFESKAKFSENKAMQALLVLNSLTKAALTVFKKDSQARNFWGAYINLMSTGHFPRLSTMMDAAQVATQDFTNAEKAALLMSTPSAVLTASGLAYNNATKSTKTLEEKKQQLEQDYLEAVEQGLIEESAIAGIIMEEADALFKAEMDFGEKTVKKILSGTAKAGQQTFKAMSKAYQANDAMFKIMQYKIEKRQYDGVYREVWNQPKNVPFEQTSLEYQQFIKDKASTATREEQPTYSKTSKGMKALSRSPIIGSFVMFQSQMYKTRGALIRNMAEMGREIKMLEKQGNKEAAKKLKAMMYRKVAGFASTIMAGTAVKYGVKAMAAMGLLGYAFDDEEEELFKELSPSYAKNANIMAVGGEFSSDPKKKVKTLDISFINPNSAFDKIFTAILSGNVLGESGAVEEFYKPFIGAEIGTSTLVHAIMGEDKYGRKFTKIYSEYGLSPDTENFARKVFYASEETINGLPKNIANVVKGITGEEDKYGNIYSLTNEILNTEVGVKLKDKSIARMYMNTVYSNKLIFNAIKKDFKEEARDAKGDKAKIDRLESKYNSIAKRQWDRLKKLYDTSVAVQKNNKNFDFEDLLKNYTNADGKKTTMFSQKLVNQLDGEFKGIKVEYDENKNPKIVYPWDGGKKKGRFPKRGLEGRKFNKIQVGRDIK